MRKKWTMAALAVGTTATVGLGLAAPVAEAAPGAASTSGSAAGSAEGPADGTASLARLLAADGHRFDHRWSDFDVLDRVVATVLEERPDSPVAVLADGRVRLTAFLPTDRAFRRLAGALTGRWPTHERGVYRVLASTVDVDTLQTVLLYHVVPGATLTAAKVLRADGTTLTTAQGGPVTVHVHGHRIRLADRDPDARDPRVNPRETDLNAGNRQVAHGIDRVLRPVDL